MPKNEHMNIEKLYKNGRLIATIKRNSDISQGVITKVNNGKDRIKPKESKLKKARTQRKMQLIDTQVVASIDKRDFLTKKAAKKAFYKALNTKGLRRK